MPPRPSSRSMEYSPARAVCSSRNSSSMALSYGRAARFTTMSSPDASTYFRKGFGLKSEVQEELAADYDGRVVDLLRSNDYVLTVGDVTIRLAREFGFCYGVERAVE